VGNLGESAELVRDGANEVVVVEAEVDEAGEVADLRRDGAVEPVVAEVERGKGAQLRDAGRDVAGEAVPVEVELGERRERGEVELERVEAAAESQSPEAQRRDAAAAAASQPTPRQVQTGEARVQLDSATGSARLDFHASSASVCWDDAAALTDPGMEAIATRRRRRKKGWTTGAMRSKTPTQ
jgi:hypothetical protein